MYRSFWRSRKLECERSINEESSQHGIDYQFPLRFREPPQTISQTAVANCTSLETYLCVRIWCHRFFRKCTFHKIFKIRRWIGVEQSSETRHKPEALADILMRIM